MAQWKPDRNLRFLRLLMFQDQTCTMRPIFAPLPIRLEQKETNRIYKSVDKRFRRH